MGELRANLSVRRSSITDSLSEFSKVSITEGVLSSILNEDMINHDIFYQSLQGLGEGLRLARRRASRDRSIEGKLAEVVDR